MERFWFDFNEIELFSQESSQISFDSSKTIVKKEIILMYTNRSIPANDGNQNDSYQGSNNFIGIAVENKLISFISNYNYDLVMSTGLQFGNLSGNFAMDIFFKPTFVLKNGFFEVDISTGITVLASNKNIWKYGGYGMNPELGFNFRLFKFLKLRAFYGVELYPNISYIATGAGIGYSF